MIYLGKKIRKLVKALELNGQLYLVNREQVYSQKLEKICTLHKLHYMMPLEEYKKLHPKTRKQSELVKEEILSTFKEIDILLELVRIWKEVNKDAMEK